MVKLHSWSFLYFFGTETANLEEIVYFMLSQGPVWYLLVVHNRDSGCTSLVLNECSFISNHPE